MGRCVAHLDFLIEYLNQGQQNFILAGEDEQLLDGKCLKPALGRINRIRVVVGLRAAHEGLGPRLAHKRGDNVAAVVDDLVGQVRVQRHPGRNRGRAGEGLREGHGHDARVRVRQVRKHADRQVGAGRVAGQEDVAGGASGVLDDVAEGFDGLRQLHGVGAVRRERVGDDEDAEIAAGGIDVFEQALEEFEIANVGGETESAAYRMCISAAQTCCSSFTG